MTCVAPSILSICLRRPHYAAIPHLRSRLHHRLTCESAREAHLPVWVVGRWTWGKQAASLRYCRTYFAFLSIRILHLVRELALTSLSFRFSIYMYFITSIVALLWILPIGCYLTEARIKNVLETKYGNLLLFVVERKLQKKNIYQL